MANQKIKLLPLTKIMIIILPIGLLVILWLYVFDPEKSTEGKKFINKKSVFIPEKKTSTDTINSKSILYNKEKEKMQNLEYKQKKDKLCVNDILELTEKRKANEQSERDILREKLYGEVTQESSSRENKGQVEKKHSVSNKNKIIVEDKNYKSASQKNISSKENEEIKPNEKVEKKQEVVTYGFGVYNSSIVGEGTNENNSNYLLAFLEKNIELKDGAEPVFVLKNAGIIGGIKLDKMAVLYGIAKFEGNRWNIYINRILNTDGNYLNINLVGYNKNMQKGIFYEGRADKALNESVNETMATTTDAVVGNGTGRILRSGTKALQMKPSLPLDQGYVMYFKEDKR